MLDIESSGPDYGHQAGLPRRLEAQVNTKPLSTLRREKRAEAVARLMNASPEQTSYWREEYETHEQYTDRMLRHIEACPISALAVMGH